MLERFVHWMLFISVVCFLAVACYDLAVHGSIQEPCCLID